MTHPDITPEQAQALDVARDLARAGIPIFVAHPAATSTGFQLPTGWQKTTPDPGVVDQWQPGMALAAVMGQGLDLVDYDPRNGSAENGLNGHMPHIYGLASTPSGGMHAFVKTLGIASRDNVAPGIDVKAGTPDGSGRGFAFLAPTIRLSKTTGEPNTYRWIKTPELDQLAAALTDPSRDTSGDNLRQLIEDARASKKPAATPPAAPAPARTYDQLDSGLRARVDGWVRSAVDGVQAELRAAGTWPIGQTDDRGRGWEKLTADAAYRLAGIAAAPWNSLTTHDAYAAYAEAAPTDDTWSPDDIDQKWSQQQQRAAATPWPTALDQTDGDLAAASWGALGFDAHTTPQTTPQPPPDPHEPAVRKPGSLLDGYLAQTIADRAITGRYCWSSGLGWMKYKAGKWCVITETHLLERVRDDMIRQHAHEARSGANEERMKRLSATLSTGRLRALVTLIRGIVEVDNDAFDAHPDLLCTPNGVVDLRTGDLLEHDPGLYLTKSSRAHYRPSATSPDWTAALQALDPEVAAWLQIRIGQAATGHPTSDDVLPILQGGGSNGKTTLIGALTSALGDHATTVPERVLLANPSDHPTELMTLRGTRLAVIEETPEGRKLTVKRLKDLLGTPTITARAIRKDNITWRATHSLVLTTNYTPVVSESDHGTWRRLSLIRFPYTYIAPGKAPTSPNQRPSVEGIRERLARGDEGAHEAVLAWVVDGARRWYDNRQTIPAPPASVARDTEAWRMDADVLLSFLTEHITFNADAHVTGADLYAQFSAYLHERGLTSWSEKTFVTRLQEHPYVAGRDITRARLRSTTPGLSRMPYAFGQPQPSTPAQYMAWRGLSFTAAQEN